MSREYDNKIIADIAKQWGKAEGNGKSKTVRDYAEQRAAEFLRWLNHKEYYMVIPRKEFVRAFEELEDAYDNGDNDMVEYYIDKIRECVDGKENDDESK